MNTPRIALALLPILAACAQAPAPSDDTSAAISAPGGDQCATLTNAAIDELRTLLVDARAAGDLDAAANGVTGAYATAANASRDSVVGAIDELESLQGFLDGYGSEGVPTSVNYVEGGWIGGSMWTIIDHLQSTVHWGTISAIYHHSYDARDSVELALQAIEVANELHARGMRCYADAYFAE